MQVIQWYRLTDRQSDGKERSRQRVFSDNEEYGA